MTMRVSHHRLILATAIVGLTLAASTPAVADIRVPVIDVGGGPVNVQVTCCRGELPGPLETTVRITVEEEEGLPAQKPRSAPALPPQVKDNTNVSDTRVVVTWQTN